MIHRYLIKRIIEKVYFHQDFLKRVSDLNPIRQDDVIFGLEHLICNQSYYFIIY